MGCPYTTHAEKLSPRLLYIIYFIICIYNKICNLSEIEYIVHICIIHSELPCGGVDMLPGFLYD